MPDETESSFGTTLRRCRMAAHLTQEELAERAGLSTNAISALERSVNQAPQHGTLDLLVAALDLPQKDAAALRARAQRRTRVGTSTENGPLQRSMGGLPRPPTRLIGREKQLADVCRRLQAADAAPLLTLTGPPGTGKTRLALAAAEALRAVYAGDVTFVPLASMSDPAMVLPALRQALGLIQTVGQAPETVLAEALRDRHLLVVLDNFEQLLAAGHALAALLGACPKLHLLVTSRIRLGLYGEHEFPVPPLQLPSDMAPVADDERAALDRVAGSEAVQLFLERARCVRPDFVLNTANADDIVGICRQLDGLPLAIELAAARVKLLPLRTLLSRLDHRLALLTGGPRDLPERQRTLRGAIAWSYDLLTPTEQTLFRHLSVFVGGCTLDAVEATLPSLAGKEATLDLLTALVDHSLIRQQEADDGQPRFWMLETLLEFARERLAVQADEQDIRRRHADYYLALAETIERGLQSPAIAAWLDRTEVELENFRSASLWLAAHGEHEKALRLVGALWFSFVPRWQAVEGKGLLLPVLSATAGLRVRARALALFGAGFLIATFDERYEAAHPLHAESLAIAQEVGDVAIAGYAYLGLGVTIKRKGDWRETSRLYARAITLFEQSDDWWGLGWACNFAAQPSTDPREVPEQPTLLERSLAIFLAHDNEHGAAETYRAMGVRAFVANDVARARDLLERSLVLNRRLVAHWNVALCLERLVGVTAVLGDLEAARRYAREVLLYQRDQGIWVGIANNLERSAGLAYLEGRPERAVQLAGAVAALDAVHGAHRERNFPDVVLKAAAWLPHVQGTLGDSAWKAAFSAGWAMPLEQAIAFAVADIWPAAAEDPGHISATRR